MPRFSYLSPGCAVSLLLRADFFSCGMWAALWLWHMGLVAPQPHDTWHLPGPGIEPMSPALVGGFSTTGPPGTSPTRFLQHPAETNDSKSYQAIL